MLRVPSHKNRIEKKVHGLYLFVLGEYDLKWPVISLIAKEYGVTVSERRRCIVVSRILERVTFRLYAHSIKDLVGMLACLVRDHGIRWEVIKEEAT